MEPMSNVLTTSDEILASARNLIMSGGYNGFSYADISEIVGIRKASIHHHFPSKVDLVRELVKRYREDGQASVAVLEQKVPNALDILKAYANHWAACSGICEVVRDGRDKRPKTLKTSQVPVISHPDVSRRRGLG